MLRKELTFVDFNDDQQVEVHYFHLSKVELIEMDVAFEGGLGNHLMQVGKSGDAAKLLATMKDLIGKAYGVRSEDGKKFTKSPGLSAEFLESQAFETLFMELAMSPVAVSEFVVGIMPKDLMDDPEVRKQLAALEASDGEVPAKVKKPKDMSREELLKAFEEKSGGLAVTTM